MMISRKLLSAIALLVPLSALAQSPAQSPVQSPAQAPVPVPAPTSTPAPVSAPSLEGHWDLRINDTTVFRFAIVAGQDGEWLGQWQRPDRFNSNGNAFYNMHGPVKTTASMAGILFLDMVELSFDDPRPGAIPDIFRFRLTGPDSAEMAYVGTNLAPYAMVRVAADAPIGGWDATRVYQRSIAVPQVDGRLDRVAPGINFNLGRPAAAPPPVVVAVPAPTPTATPSPTATPTPAATPAASEPAPRIGRDFLNGL